jgi:hypothetical protein
MNTVLLYLYLADVVNSAGTTEPYGIDPYAATRRTIVRAAAEIGKEMK